MSMLSGTVAGENKETGEVGEPVATARETETKTTGTRHNLRPQQRLRNWKDIAFIRLTSTMFGFSTYQSSPWFPICGAVEASALQLESIPSIEPVMSDFLGLSAMQQCQLHYVQACDLANESFDDPDDVQWKVWKIVDHKISKQSRVDSNGNQVQKCHIRYKVHWLNGETTWVQESAV